MPIVPLTPGTAAALSVLNYATQTHSVTNNTLVTREAARQDQKLFLMLWDVLVLDIADLAQARFTFQNLLNIDPALENRSPSELLQLLHSWSASNYANNGWGFRGLLLFIDPVTRFAKIYRAGDTPTAMQHVDAHNWRSIPATYGPRIGIPGTGEYKHQSGRELFPGSEEFELFLNGALLGYSAELFHVLHRSEIRRFGRDQHGLQQTLSHLDVRAPAVDIVRQLIDDVVNFAHNRFNNDATAMTVRI